MSKTSSSNSSKKRELNVSNSKIESSPVVNDPSDFDILPNPHTVDVSNDTVKNDTRLDREILAYSTPTEPFAPANYSNNARTVIPVI